MLEQTHLDRDFHTAMRLLMSTETQGGRVPQDQKRVKLSCKELLVEGAKPFQKY